MQAKVYQESECKSGVVSAELLGIGADLFHPESTGRP
jgi:hypothetical protein